MRRGRHLTAGIPRVVAIVVLAGGAVTFGLSGAGAARTRRCPPTGARVIGRGGQLRVYSSGVGFASRRVEACVIGRGTRFPLIAPAKGFHPRRDLGGFAFAGATLAYVEVQFGVDSGTRSIHVVDVARRRILRDIGDVGSYVDAGILGSTSIADLVVAASGSVAWISETNRRGQPGSTLAVHAAATSGPVATLDEGPDIGAASLSLSGATVSWRHAGVERTARLP